MVVTEAMDKVRINYCTVEDLVKLPGIGMATAERILVLREASGDITEESLISVPHIRNVAELIKLFDFTPSQGAARREAPPSPLPRARRASSPPIMPYPYDRFPAPVRPRETASLPPTWSHPTRPYGEERPFSSSVDPSISSRRRGEGTSEQLNTFQGPSQSSISQGPSQSNSAQGPSQSNSSQGPSQSNISQDPSQDFQGSEGREEGTQRRPEKDRQQHDLSHDCLPRQPQGRAPYDSEAPYEPTPSQPRRDRNEYTSYTAGERGEGYERDPALDLFSERPNEDRYATDHFRAESQNETHMQNRAKSTYGPPLRNSRRDRFYNTSYRQGVSPRQLVDDYYDQLPFRGREDHFTEFRSFRDDPYYESRRGRSRGDQYQEPPTARQPNDNRQYGEYFSPSRRPREEYYEPSPGQQSRENRPHMGHPSPPCRARGDHYRGQSPVRQPRDTRGGYRDLPRSPPRGTQQNSFPYRDIRYQQRTFPPPIRRLSQGLPTSPKLAYRSSLPQQSSHFISSGNSGSHQRPAPKAILPRSITFNGTGNWHAFFAKFTSFADDSNWNAQQRQNQLCWCLEGKASEYYASLVKREPNIQYFDIVFKLERRYAPQELPEVAQVHFTCARQTSEESCAEWADRLFTLATQAFPKLPDEYVQKQLVLRFCQGSTDREAGQHTLNCQPATLEQAIRITRMFQHARQAMHGRPRKDIKQVSLAEDTLDIEVRRVGNASASPSLRPADSTLEAKVVYLEKKMETLQTSFKGQLDSIEAQVRALQSTVQGLVVAMQEKREPPRFSPRFSPRRASPARMRPRSPGQENTCFKCGKPGHFKRECPEVGSEKNVSFAQDQEENYGGSEEGVQNRPN